MRIYPGNLKYNNPQNNNQIIRIKKLKYKMKNEKIFYLK